MRANLLYNPFDLIERLAIASRRRRRLRRLRGTPAAALTLGHIDSLELLESLAASPPQTIYDVGANIGTWTCLAKSILPSTRVEAFEPLAMHFEGFRRWTAPWPAEVRLHAVALGAAPSTLTMNVMDFSDASSFLSLNAGASAELNIKPARSETVPVVRLDDYVREHRLPPADLIKLDVQGYELEALRGAEESLRHARAVLSEVSFREYYRGQPLFHDIAAFLGARSFVVTMMAENTVLGQPLGQTDVLFTRPA